MTAGLRSALQAGALLGLAALLASALLAGVHVLSRERIADGEQRLQWQALTEVLPADRHDNDLLASRIEVEATHWLGAGTHPLYRGRRDDQPQALVLEAIANDGYNGDIRLLLAIGSNGRLLGLRILAHGETPGLGDAIARPDWQSQFLGNALDAPPHPAWRLRGDDGRIDALTGATISSQALLGAVRRALAFVQLHGSALHAADAGARLRFDDAPADTVR
ncbi:MAG TPA: RnfABCDGE type electron transport complex subunit G [Arenimonas sp.]|nr:RnfABCDGE type electron transport complex subunit G [Arenimonas sp.]